MVDSSSPAQSAADLERDRADIQAAQKSLAQELLKDMERTYASPHADAQQARVREQAVGAMSLQQTAELCVEWQRAGYDEQAEIANAAKASSESQLQEAIKFYI